MDVQQAVFARVGGERHLGEVYRSEARAVVAVANQLLADLDADIALCFHRTAADMGREDAVVELS